MPTTGANTALYATRIGRYPVVNIASATAANTYTLVVTADSAGSLVLDLLFRSADATARVFDIVIATTGSQATAENARVAVNVPASSGNNGSTAIVSLISAVPSLFALDLAGNRCINIESGTSIYVKNQTLTAGAIFVTAIVRDYTA